MTDRNSSEFTPPREEYSASGGEFTPPAREYPQAEAAQPPAPREKSRRLLRKMCLAAAFVVTVAALPDPAPVPMPAETVPPVTVPSEPTPVPTEAETLPPETEPVPIVYPLTEGTVAVTVYNDTIHFDEATSTFSLQVLYQGTFPAADFTGVPLPDPEPEEGFTFLGYVLYGGDPAGGQPRYYPLQDAFTPEDAALVAPDPEGVRSAQIHAQWHYTGDGQQWMNLTLDANGGAPTVEFDPTTPMASGGSVFLCVYPEPERPGFRFAGWYREPECTGKPVEVLPAADFFAPGESEPNWRSPVPITLYARWLPE